MGDLVLGMLIGFVVGVLVCGLAWGIAGRQRQPGKPAAPPPVEREAPAGTPLLEQLLAQTETAESLRQNLRVKFLYNEKKVDEAIDFERQRAPQSSEEELMQAAIARWERDNR
jgi:hypothetical protein